jgi:hypothetical protein
VFRKFANNHVSWMLAGTYKRFFGGTFAQQDNLRVSTAWTWPLYGT